VSNNDHHAEIDNHEDIEPAAGLGPIDRLKLLPVTMPFGLQAAALAGLAIAAGAAAAGVTGIFDDPAGAVAFPGPVCSKGGGLNG
jgi:hypothetical protein